MQAPAIASNRYFARPPGSRFDESSSFCRTMLHLFMENKYDLCQ
ncbi:hypothetical protein WCP94_003158 [Bilophila wadsworthia]